MNVYDTNTCLAYIESLLDRKLITFDETIKSDYHINPIILLSGEFNAEQSIDYEDTWQEYTQ